MSGRKEDLSFRKMGLNGSAQHFIWGYFSVSQKKKEKVQSKQFLCYVQERYSGYGKKMKNKVRRSLMKI